jgi:hypothetical protein
VSGSSDRQQEKDRNEAATKGAMTVVMSSPKAALNHQARLPAFAFCQERVSSPGGAQRPFVHRYSIQPSNNGRTNAWLETDQAQLKTALDGLNDADLAAMRPKNRGEMWTYLAHFLDDGCPRLAAWRGDRLPARPVPDKACVRQDRKWSANPAS